MEIELAILALLVAGYALIAARLDRLSVGPALAFMAIGIVLADDVLGPISLKPEAEPIRLLAEVTLTLLLFADASTIRSRSLRQDAAPVARLLVIGLPLTIVFGTVIAVLHLPGHAARHRAAHRRHPGADRRSPRPAGRDEPGRPRPDPATVEHRERAQ